VKVKNVDICVGCQFGSEAKGLVASWLAKINHYDWLVSVNSAQAGHTAPLEKDGKVVEYIVTRQLPSACITNRNAKIYIGAGAVINPQVLIAEIIYLESVGIPVSERLYISAGATLITSWDLDGEKELRLTDRLGSTPEGVGYALSRRALRQAQTVGSTKPDISLILNSHGIKSFTIVGDRFTHEIIEGDVFIEGSQGYGLSVFNSYYPYTTSRDTTASAFLSYAKLPPLNIRDIYGVYRTFPIRVGGNSGQMYEEIEWEEIDKISGYQDIKEYTTVTSRLRRVGMWDAGLAYQATQINGVNKPILTFANYLCKDYENAKTFEDLHAIDRDAYTQIVEMSEDIGIPWFAISTSKEGGFIMDGDSSDRII